MLALEMCGQPGYSGPQPRLCPILLKANVNIAPMMGHSTQHVPSLLRNILAQCASPHIFQCVPISSLDG